MIAVGSQLVGLKVKSFAVDEHVDVLYLSGDAVDDARDRVRAARVGGDRQFGCASGRLRSLRGRPRSRRGAVARVFGARVVLEVERARLHRVDDRQPERGAGVLFGDVDLPARDRHRVVADADGDRRFADQRFGAAGAGVGLGFGAELDACQHAREAGGHVQHHALQVLLAVFAAERRRQRAEGPGVDVRAPAGQRRGERQLRARARRAVRAGGDVEVEVELTGALPDHGVNEAVVV